MSQENTYLVIFAILLCSLNLFMGPLAFYIAKMFGRLSPSETKVSRTDPAERGGDLPASTPVPPVVHSRSGEYLRADSFADENAQISKYR
jgi:hypothetical protein